MPSEESDRIAILQGTPDLIVLQTLETMGIANRLTQVSEDLLHLNQDLVSGFGPAGAAGRQDRE